MTEIVVKIKSPEPFTANRAWLVIKPLNQDFGTPLRIQAKNQITRLWEHIKRGGTYTDMVVTLQLATHKDCGRAHGRQLRGRRESGGGFA